MVTSKDGLKAQQEYSAEDCAAIMVTSKDGLKAQQEYRTDDCAAIMGTSKDGLKAQQEYRTDDCAAIMGTSKDGLKAQYKNTAQGSALGLSLLTKWRAVSATGASEMLVRSFLLLFQSAS